jgi:hypothetical protein
MALAAERNTPSQSTTPTSARPYKQKASVTIYKGSLVALNGGYAAPGATATGRVAIGRAKKTTVTGAGDGSNPTGMDQPYIEVEEGTFKWLNSGTDAVVAADVGATVWIEDDQTVSHTTTGKSAAGKCIKLDSDGVWVETTVGVP